MYGIVPVGMRETIAAVLVATMLVVAGCAGGLGTDGEVETDGNGDGQADGSAAGATGTINFYVSDDPGAIGDFEHLNVTITMVGFQKAGGGEGDEPEDEDESAEDRENESDGEAERTENDADGEEESETEDESDVESESESEPEDGSDGDRAGWVEYEVENVTVDLTELQGANATRLDALDAPAGEYDKVFVHVGDVEGVLTTGEEVNVKLPSEKLQIESEFEVAANSSVDFVFDITVFEAGNSGKYILQPVISESGTGDEVEIRERDDGRDGEAERDESERDDDDESIERTGELDVEIRGSVEAGSTVTVKASRGGDPVAGATVEVDGEPVGETDADGRLSVDVPGDAEALAVTVVDGDDEAETERDLDHRDGGERLLA